MFTPQQMIPFLQHPSPAVVQHALSYLVDASDPAPATTEDFWLAFDATTDDDLRRSLLNRMQDMPQSDTSITRSILQLSAETDISNRYYLLRA